MPRRGHPESNVYVGARLSRPGQLVARLKTDASRSCIRVAQGLLCCGLRTTADRRILDRLKTAGLVASSQRLIGGPGGGSAGLVYFLTSDGQKLADALTGSPKRRPPHSGSFLMRHGQMTAEVALAFRRVARTHAGHELVEWECDWAAAERLGSSFVVPDARMAYETPKWVLNAFIEVDLATEGTRFFAGKIDRYLRLYLSRAWRQHLSVWPIILTVTPSDERASMLKAATAPLLDRPYYGLRLSGIFECWFTSLGALVGARGPLGAIWQIAGRDGSHALVDDLDEPVLEIGEPLSGALAQTRTEVAR